MKSGVPPGFVCSMAHNDTPLRRAVAKIAQWSISVGNAARPQRRRQAPDFAAVRPFQHSIPHSIKLETMDDCCVATSI
jgi:hypothetical protein